jgi:hypothetical protein
MNTSSSMAPPATICSLLRLGTSAWKNGACSGATSPRTRTKSPSMRKIRILSLLLDKGFGKVEQVFGLFGQIGQLGQECSFDPGLREDRVGFALTVRLKQYIKKAGAMLGSIADIGVRTPMATAPLPGWVGRPPPHRAS